MPSHLPVATHPMVARIDGERSWRFERGDEDCIDVYVLDSGSPKAAAVMLRTVEMPGSNMYQAIVASADGLAQFAESDTHFATDAMFRAGDHIIEESGGGNSGVDALEVQRSVLNRMFDEAAKAAGLEMDTTGVDFSMPVAPSIAPTRVDGEDVVSERGDDSFLSRIKAALAHGTHRSQPEAKAVENELGAPQDEGPDFSA